MSTYRGVLVLEFVIGGQHPYFPCRDNRQAKVGQLESFLRRRREARIHMVE